VAVRASRSVPFGRSVNLGRSVNSGFSDERPDISADGRTLFFMSNRLGGHGSFDLWETS
jgi:OOP family OmpA-OmpF porin